jgi:hypothetical protein
VGDIGLSEFPAQVRTTALGHLNYLIRKPLARPFREGKKGRHFHGERVNSFDRSSGFLELSASVAISNSNDSPYQRNRSSVMARSAPSGKRSNR